MEHEKVSFLPFNEFVEKIHQEKDENDEVQYINHISHEFSIKINKNENEISKNYDELVQRFDKTEPIMKSLEDEHKKLELRLNSSEERSKWNIGIYLTLLFIMLSTMSFTIEHFVKVVRDS
jgi:hypothetical protein